MNETFKLSFKKEDSDQWFKCIHKSFNEELVLSFLKSGFIKDQSFHLRIPQEFQYIIRKHLIKNDSLDQLCIDLISKTIDKKSGILLSRALKYLIKNGSKLSIQILIDILKISDNHEIKSEIAYALGYKINQSQEQLGQKDIHEIQRSINNISPDAKSFLNSQMQKQNQIKKNDFMLNSKKLDSSKHSSRNVVQIQITKNQQTIKVKNQNRKSEETNINIQRLTDILKSKSMKTKLNSNVEQIPPIKRDNSGNNRSYFGGTYTNIKILYGLARCGYIIKDDDKDNYLVSKLFCKSKKWNTGGILNDLLIDRMIVETFQIISKTQSLNGEVINKLMLGLDNLDSVNKLCIGISDKQYLAESILYDSWMPSDRNAIEKPVMDNIELLIKPYSKSLSIFTIQKKIDCSLIREVQNILLNQINQIRLDSISTVYNCVIRDRSILSQSHLLRIGECLEESDSKLRGFAIKILMVFGERKEINYHNLFNVCLMQLENNNNLEQSISYIFQQTKNLNRCQQLFDNKTISRISSILSNNSFDDQTKIECCQIINNILEYTFSQGLSREDLQNCKLIIENANLNHELIAEVLKSVFITAEKQNLLPEQIIISLIKNIKNFSDEQANFIIMTLGTICESTMIEDFNELSYKLLDNRVIILEGVDIQFKDNSLDNVGQTSISSIACKIFLSMLQKGRKITEKSFQDLAFALDSNDKQTRILSAKSLSLASFQNDSIDNSILLKVREYINDNVLDIAIYTRIAYTKGLIQFGKGSTPITSDHMEFLPAVYTFEILKLQNEDFTQQINKNVLQILLLEAKKQQYDDSIFRIFDYILSSDELNKRIVMNVLKYYTYKKNLIPVETITHLENIYGNPELSDDVLQVLENVIRNGQQVGYKILKTFADSSQSLEILDIASNNQDLCEKLFNKCELERAGEVIAKQMFDKKEAILYLIRYSNKGYSLSIKTLKALENELNNNQVLQILINISKNNQIIPDFLINKLIKVFNPQKEQPELITIFANIAQNNQKISDELQMKLEIAMDNKIIADQVLPIFVLQGQKNQYLSVNIINKICNKFLITEIQALKQQISSVICSIISKKNNFDFQIVKRALIHGIREEDSYIVTESISGFKKFASLTTLDQESINELIQKVTTLNCDTSVKNNICSLLQSCKLNKYQEKKLGLASLCVTDNKNELLNKILEMSQKFDLLEQNFFQINLIIDKEPYLQSKAIDILIKCQNIQDIPDTLIDTVATLMVSTPSNEQKEQCCILISQIAKVGRKVSDKIISLIASFDDAQQAQSILKVVAKNQEISNYVGLLMKFDNLPLSINTKHLSKLLQELKEEIQNGLELSDQIIDKILSIQYFKNENKDGSHLEEFATIFSILLMNQSKKYLSNKQIVETIEQAIMSSKLNHIILNGYQHIIKTKNYQNLAKTIDYLTRFLDEDEQYEHLNFVLLSCIKCASEAGEITERGFEILEMNLYNQDENVRRLSYQGLRAAKNNGLKSQGFDSWCTNIITNLGICNHSENDLDLDLLEIISSLKYIDMKQITLKPKNEWPRELLLSDLLERYNLDDIERIDFYKSWLEMEQNENFKNGRSEIILKTLIYIDVNATLSFGKLSEILNFISLINFQIANDILNCSINPYTDLKQKWVENLLIQLFKQKLNPTYISKHAFDLIKKFSTDIIDKLLHSIREIKSLREFELLIDFAEQNNLKASDISLKNVYIDDLKRSLEIKFLVNQIKKSEDLQKLENIIDNLLLKKWTFQQLNSIFSFLQYSSTSEQVKKEQMLIQILEILDQYKLSQNDFQKVQNTLRADPEYWLTEINKIAVKSHFQSIGKIKNTSELVNELQNNNLFNISLSNLIKNGLQKEIEKIQDSKLKCSFDLNLDLLKRIKSDISSLVIDKEKVKELGFISEWTESEISAWVRIVKSFPEIIKFPQFNTEALAVIKKANFIKTGFDMTENQILCCMVALNSNKDMGRLLQVATGEGKSTIISVLAIMNCLKGKRVDIITSSPVLAERDSKEKAQLYQIFGLSCADNSDKSVYIKGTKDCYKKDIVYGEASQFLFDALRDEYNLLDTLGNRKCEIAIVDEVDSMLIDDSFKIARLSSTIAGMDLLQPIYHFLWQWLFSIQEKIIEIDDKMYLFYGKLSYENGKIKLEYANEKEEINQILDLENYIKSTQDINMIGQQIEEDCEQFLKKYLQNKIEELLEKDIKVPNNFKEYANKQIPKWVNNALVAFNYQENVHYIVQEGAIKPVDYNSTGIVQNSTNWSDGLHQFLQLKHQLKMTSETFTTNFLSITEYIKRYQSNLFGLTGTLGSIKSKKVLQEIYNVDLITIPTLRQKQYLELPPKVTASQTKWLNEICFSAINEANKERGILIICETIEYSFKIATKLRKDFRADAIKLYTMNNMNQEREVERINPGEIIIATNLAGRGTDIKTDEIEKNGGLHVIVTYMPSNERVQEQAFGRTARQGRCGSGQMILNSQLLLEEYGNICPQEVKKLREIIQSEIQDRYLNKQFKINQIKERIFQKFCSLLKEIRLDIRTKSCVQAFECNIVSAIEEQWAMYLQKIDDGEIPIQQADDYYEQFSSEIINQYKNDTIIKNPFYLIGIANDQVQNSSFFMDNYNLPMNNFNKAKNQDENSVAAAYAGIAWLLLKGKESIWTSNKQNENYKQQVIIEINSALAILNFEIASLETLKAIQSKQFSGTNSDLQKQLIQKMNILGSYISSLENVGFVIKKSQRLIDIVGFKNYQNLNEYEKQSDDLKQCYDFNNKIQRITTFYYGIEKQNQIIQINTILDNNDEFEIVFNDLTVRKDTITIDQAVNIINQGFQNNSNYFSSKSILDKNYKNICINLKQINDKRLQALLNPDIEIEEVTKEVAISQLKDKSSYLHRSQLSEIFLFGSCKVNLEITHNHKKKEIHNNLQVRNVIKIIEKQTDNNLRFNLIFIQQNKVYNFLSKEIFPNSSLNIQYIRLNYKNAKNKLNQIKSQEIYLEISDIKENLIRVINHPKVQTLQLFNNENQTFDTVYTFEAIKRIEKTKDDNLSIKINNLDCHFSNEIIDLCENAIFNINFIKVIPSSIIQKINEIQINKKQMIEEQLNEDEINIQQMNVSFNNLGQIEAIKLIPYIRNEKIDFSLMFRNLDKNKTKQFLNDVSIEQENIEINQIKTLNELFMNESKPYLELQEFSARGIEYLLEVNEKKFIPYISILGVGALAFIQIFAGVVFISTGFGANVGIGLITEGAVDVVTALRAYSKRQFSWSDYRKQKAVSLLISATSMGLSALKDAAKGASKLFNVKNLTVAAANEAVEQTGVQLLTKPNYCGSLKLFTKQLSVATSEAVVREGLNYACDSLAHFTLEHFKPQISLSIQNKVITKFSQPTLMSLMCKFYAIDIINKTKNLKGEVDKIVAEIINPEHNFWRKQWNSVGGPLCKGILSDPKFSPKYSGYFSKCLRIYGTLNGMHQIQEIIDNVHDKLVMKLSQVDKEKFLIANLLQNSCKISRQDSREIVEILKNENIIRNGQQYNAQIKECCLNISSVSQIELNPTILYHEYINPLVFDPKNQEYRNFTFPKTTIDQVNFGDFNQHKSKIIHTCKLLHENTISLQIEDLNQIMKSISDTITDQIIRITESHLISPWSSLAMGALTNAISKRVQHNFVVSSEDNTTELNTINQNQKQYFQYLQQKKQNGEFLNKNERGFLENYDPYITVSKQIIFQAQEYTINNSHHTIIEDTNQENKNNLNLSNSVISEEIQKISDDIKLNYPGDIGILNIMLSSYRIKCKIVNPGYKMRQEDIDKGINIIYFQEGDRDSQGNETLGHFYTTDSDGNIIMNNSKNNNCCFAAVQQLLKQKGIDKTIQQLRNETSQIIKEQHQKYSKVLEAQKWIQKRYPQEANKHLYKGGFLQNMQTDKAQEVVEVVKEVVEVTKDIAPVVAAATTTAEVAAATKMVESATLAFTTHTAASLSTLAITGGVIIGLITICGVTYYIYKRRSESYQTNSFNSSNNDEFIDSTIPPADDNDQQYKYYSVVPAKKQRVIGLMKKANGEEFIQNNQMIQGAHEIQEGNNLIKQSYLKQSGIEAVNCGISLYNMEFIELMTRLNNLNINLQKYKECSTLNLNLSINNDCDVKQVQEVNQVFDYNRQKVDNDINQQNVNKIVKNLNKAKEIYNYNGDMTQMISQRHNDKTKNKFEEAIINFVTDKALNDSNYKTEIQSEIVDIFQDQKKIKSGEEIEINL